MRYLNTISLRRAKRLEEEAAQTSAIHQLRKRRIVLKRLIRHKTKRIKFIEKQLRAMERLQ